MRVAELGAGGGYTTELLARVVGPTGIVYGQNTPFILARLAERPWSARLVKPVMARVVRVDREFDDPLPPEARNLDLVLNVLFYHDTVWMGVDRARMNAAVFRSLRPAGIYGIVDHSGRPGSGTADVKTLHRIEEEIVRAEVEAAGFRLVGEAGFLRNPATLIGHYRFWNRPARGYADQAAARFGLDLPTGSSWEQHQRARRTAVDATTGAATHRGRARTTCTTCWKVGRFIHGMGATCAMPKG
jgi:predicted methyltransferase